MGRYSRGRRGGPAKAVGRATGARVRIPLFPPIDTDKNFLSVFLNIRRENATETFDN